MLVVAMGLLAVLAGAMPASAHGGDESQEGLLLVQQALGHLAHDGGHLGADAALEKVDDALAASDQDGVDVATVQRAKAALTAGQVGPARTLLQDSIKAGLAELPAATGNGTGTKFVLPAMPGRDNLAGREWLFLGGSAALLVIGVGLAVRYRPADTIGDLRRLLIGPTARHLRQP